MVQKNSLKFKPVILIGGTTGVGKSEISIQIAKEIAGEIISADSMQIYKNFDLGTAKILPEEMQGIAHYLIDIKNANESYSVAQFKSDAEKLMVEILNKGKVPIVVGGTGLYLNSLLFGYQFGGRGEKQKSKPDFDFCPIVIELDRAQIYEKINKRVDIMIEKGLVAEIQNLLKSGAKIEDAPFRAIGYKEILPYLSGESSLQCCVEKLKQNTRNYAKRQVTWFKQWKDIAFFTNPDKNKILNHVKEFLKNGTKN